MPVELPDGVVHVWHWFNDLHSARGVGWSGPLPLSYTEIAAWCSLTGERLRPWELASIRAMDQRLLDGAPTAARTETTNSRPMSPELFDALF